MFRMDYAAGEYIHAAKKSVANFGRSAFTKVGAVGTGLALLSAKASAEVPTEVTAALTDLKADALTVAGVVLAAVVAVFAFKFIRRGL
ncbi:MAG: major capsid protein [Burkholderiaceae bacterium]